MMPDPKRPLSIARETCPYAMSKSVSVFSAVSIQRLRCGASAAFAL